MKNSEKSKAMQSAEKLLGRSLVEASLALQSKGQERACSHVTRNKGKTRHPGHGKAVRATVWPLSH
jgi:hypothetical protein